MPSESDGADVQQRSLLVVTGQWLSNFNYCTQKGNIEQLSPEEQLEYGGKGGNSVTVKLFYEPKIKISAVEKQDIQDESNAHLKYSSTADFKNCFMSLILDIKVIMSSVTTK